MNKILFIFLLSVIPTVAFGEGIQIKPENVFQGDPVALFLEIPVSEVEEGTFLGKKLFFFTVDGLASSIVPTDLYMKAGTYPVVIKLKDGTTLTKDIEIKVRQKETFVLPIPPQLGPNTPANQTKVITKLIDENKILSQAYYRHMRPLWKTAFRYPLQDSSVTDVYGTVRQTGNYSVSHKGTDFKASIGMDVYPVNRGVVRFAGTLPTYGKSIIIDHGLGITSLYLHLSKIHVVVGQLALPTQSIGKSGDTGFSGGPHLHLSIKIDGISIDPETFLTLFD